MFNNHKSNVFFNKPSVCINSLLSGYYQNVRGLRTKLNLLKCSIPSSTHDFIIFTETWLNNNFFDNELGFTQHNVFRRDRTEKTSPHNRGGGVLVAIKKTFNSKLLNIDTLNVEQVFVKVIVGDLLIIFCAVYFPPNSDLQLYLNHLSVLESIDSSFPNCKFIICGDYNIPSLSWESDKHGLKCVNFLSSQVGSSLIESCSVLNLYQFNSIINAHGNILDLVFSNLLESSINLYDDPFVPIDPCHPPIQINVRLPISQPILNNDRTIYNYVKGDYINANLFFNSFNWLNTFRHLNTEAAALVFQHALLEALHSFVPQKTISTSHNFPYWFNKELKTLVWKKNKAHSIYIKNKSKSNYEKFSLLRARYKSQSKIVFHDFIHRSESEIISNPKYFWNWVNFNTKSHGIPNSVFLGDTIANNGAAIANLFSDYFSSVYNTSPVHSPDEPYIFASTYQFDHIIPNKCSISLNEVSDGLRTLIKCRSPGPDGVSGYFLANLANSIAYPIFILYNKSLEEGVFPSIWKTSSITPVFKKGDKSNVKNYRPISGLVQIGKLLEKLVLAQMIKPINNILDNSQHGFRPGRSTLTCNLSLQNFILNAFNDNCQVDVIYTDFAKAFDRVDHELLIIILGKLGFSHPLLSWFKSYLTNRSQFTQVHGFYSETVPVPSGTPQGGHLSPILFNLFINGLSLVLKKCQILFFADDLKIFTRISSFEDCLVLQDELNILYVWCRNWGMCLNTDKCYSMCFYRSRRHITYTYSINDVQLRSVSSITDLGVTLTTNLNFRDHIESVVKKSLKVLGFIKRHSSEFKNLSSFKLLYCALVRSILEYGAPIWNPYTKTDIDFIERVQNRFLKFVAFKFNLTIDNHDYTQIRSFLNIPALSSRREIADISFIYKLINGITDDPDLLKCIPFTIPAYNNRSTSLFYIPVYSTNYLKNSPIPRAMALCNKLSTRVDFFFSSLKEIINVHMNNVNT
jgi:hypothetical protein